VYLTWSLRYGLSNQLYSHMNGLALALMLGVDGAILPPAVCRATFNTTLAHLADDGLWSPQPLGTLLDVPQMQAHWREKHGIDLQEVRVCAGNIGGAKLVVVCSDALQQHPRAHWSSTSLTTRVPVVRGLLPSLRHLQSHLLLHALTRGGITRPVRPGV
jgi:hypothetical protein